MTKFISFLAILFAPALLQAQTIPVDTLDVTLDEVRIEASRGTLTSISAPLSVGILNRSEEDVAFEPGLSLNYVLNRIPGVWINNRENYALGERMSIRGMGWRAAFGVRGIYVLLDGVPLTVPDGQTVLDIIDPAFIQSAEIIRGPSSVFWGNASGGTLFLSTKNFSSQPSGYFRSYAGSFNTYKFEAGGSANVDGNNYQLFASYTDREGFRENSQFSATRVGGNAEFNLNSRTSLGVNFAFVDAPDTRHPGSLNKEDALETPSAANPLFVNASAGKIWRQGQLGMRLHYDSDFGLISATAYGLGRNLHNPLPFNDIEVDRIVAGSRLSIQNQYNSFVYGFGVDASIQRDDRRNYDYENGFERAGLSLDQIETVTNTGLFVQLGTNYDRFNVTGSLRADFLNFESDDNFNANNEDQSGSRIFNAVSPSLGFAYQIYRSVLYANISTAFESPTTTELVNRPDMTGGFNPDLEPERTLGFELGSRGAIYKANLNYDVAIFRMIIENRLIPFQTESGGDRVFYRNEGSTLHDGFEISLNWQPISSLQIYGAYTWSNFIFDSIPEDEAPDLRNNQIPGIPEHRIQSQIRYSRNIMYLSSSIEYTGEYFTNDTNTAVNDSYVVLDVQLGAKDIGLNESLSISPFIKINNITNTRYNTSVSINANFGRYYEPAAPRAIYAGFTMNFGMER